MEKQYDCWGSGGSLVLCEMSYWKKKKVKKTQKGLILQELNLSQGSTFTLEQFV